MHTTPYHVSGSPAGSRVLLDVVVEDHERCVSGRSRYQLLSRWGSCHCPKRFELGLDVPTARWWSRDVVEVVSLLHGEVERCVYEAASYLSFYGTLIGSVSGSKTCGSCGRSRSMRLDAT
jgi:hypothetical protein